MSEALDVQIKYRVDKRRFKTRDAARKAVQRARAHFLKTGDSIPGVLIIGLWRNPNRTNVNRTQWKSTEDYGQSLSEFWETFYKNRGILAHMRGGSDPINFTAKHADKIPSPTRSKSLIEYHRRIRKIQWERGVSYKSARAIYRRKRK